MRTATTALRCWAEIDCAALRHNAAVVRDQLAPDVALLAVIKANGYGHGLAAVAAALREHAQLFGVANLQEAVEARKAVPHPVIILGPALPDERAEIVRQRFIPSVSSLEEARDFNEAAAGLRAELNCTIDSGMGRMGMAEPKAVDTITAIAGLPNVRIHSVSTHLPSADDDLAFTAKQLAGFRQTVALIRRGVSAPFLVHALPSAGVIGFADSAYDIVRAGLVLYGASPIAAFQEKLRPALTLKTRVALLRDLPAGSSISYGRTFIAQEPMRVATLSIGYEDGLPRAVSGRGAAVLIGGQRCPILGRVTMDLTMVDVTHVPDVKLGDEAVVIGQQGSATILATEVAERASTIAWEIFTGIGSRVARVYL